MRPPKQNWKVATEEDIGSYRADLVALLNDINLPCLDCTDIRCKNPDHLEALDDYIFDIIKAIKNMHSRNIPYSNNKNQANMPSRRKRIPGWNEFVSPLK